MSVVGFDFGTATCYTAAAKTRGIETLDNDFSDRATPTCLSFNSLRRFTGTSASNQKITNISNTVSGFKNLLGLKFSDPRAVYEMKKNLFVKYVQLEDDEIGIKVTYLNEEKIYTPIQLSAMMLSELKSNAARHFGSTAMSVVLSCPVYFGSEQRRALAAAAYIAELNLMGILNDSEATAVAYGLYNTFSKSETLKSKIVMFLDIGYSSTQVYLCNFDIGNKISVISSVGSTRFGGRDVDERICSYFIEEFITKYKIDTRSNLKSWMKLLIESSNLKKKINSSNCTLPLHIDCFMNDIDVSGTLSRDQVDKMCESLVENEVETLIDQAIAESTIPIIDFAKQVSGIEIIGGSTRLTMIKNMIQRKFNLEVSTTLNCDEAVSRGCALYCAKLSPSIQIKPFEVLDFVYYDVRAQVYVDNIMIDQVDLFKRGKQSPCTCLLTITPESNFGVVLQQKISDKQGFIDVSNWVVRGVAKDTQGNTQKVKVRVRQDQNSYVVVTQAQMFEIVENAVDATPENEKITNDEKEPKSPSKEKKQLFKTINLVVEQVNSGVFDEKVLLNYLTVEKNILAQIASETARSNAKNAFEEFIYIFRDKLDGVWREFVDETTAAKIKSNLNEQEDWIYDEGEFQQTQVYIKKFDELKNLAKPIEDRCINSQQAQQLIDEFSNVILHYQKLVAIFADSNDERYKHIPNEKMDIVSKECQNALDTFTKAQTKFNKWIKTNPFPFKLQDLYNTMNNLKTKCDPIVNMPVPVKEPEPPVDVTDSESLQTQMNEQQEPISESKNEDVIPPNAQAHN